MAVKCFLSTVLATADSMAELFPEIGEAYRNRWRRLPQRMAFDLSPEFLEGNRQAFENDIRTFSQFASRYVNEGMPLFEAIASTGGQVADTILDRTASHVVLLETLAESMDTIADLDGPPELRDSLEHQSAGLRSCARLAEQELLPLVTRLRRIIRECERVLEVKRQSIVVDPETGFLNAKGVRQEFEVRLAERKRLVVLLFECEAAATPGEDNDAKQFALILSALAGRISDQFRPNDSIGRSGQKFAVIFDGEEQQASHRRDGIQRGIVGKYPAGDSKVHVTAEIEVIECDSVQVLDEFFGEGAAQAESVVPGEGVVQAESATTGGMAAPEDSAKEQIPSEPAVAGFEE